jgi:hypothetical protein
MTSSSVTSIEHGLVVVTEANTLKTPMQGSKSDVAV